MKKIKLILFFILFYSCTSSDINDVETSIGLDGFYKISSIISSEILDLDNNGFSSNNLFEEIPDYFNDSFDLTIKKIEISNPFKYSLGIYLPSPNQFIDEPFGSIYYNQKAFFTRFNPENNTELITEAISLDDTTSLISLVHLDNLNLKIQIRHSFYDFETNLWKEVETEIFYVKTN